MSKNAECQSILIVRTSSIGDVVQTFPVLEYLREKFPSCQIDWVVEKRVAPILEAHPFLSQVLQIDSKSASFKDLRLSLQNLRRNSYDVLFDLQGNTKSALVTACAKAEKKVGFDRTAVRERPNLLATSHRYPVRPDLDVRSKYLCLVQAHFQDTAAFTPKGVRLQLTQEEEGK